MKEIQSIILLCITGLALLMDCRRGKIPNRLVVAGLCAGWFCQLVEKGVLGILHFAGGVGMPVVLLAGLFYFRMIGAGDIKLLSAVGAIMGVDKIGSCMLYSFLAGGCISAILMCKRRNLWKRLNYFFAYIGNYFKTGEWVSYRENQTRESCLHFSIPIFISVLLYMGGIY